MEATSTLADYHLARRRVFWALFVLAAVMSIGATGYLLIGHLGGREDWTLAECIYMTAITVSTVGYSESLDVHAVAWAREWTLLLIVFGIAANLWVVSAITSFFVEGDFTHLRRYRQMQRRMQQLEHHQIVCGIGTTGIHVLSELRAMGIVAVAIDRNPERLAEVPEDVLTILGDATEDEILKQAGLARARGIVAALDDDKTNMYVVISARQANPHIRIVAKAVTPSAIEKLRRAGASSVVSPNLIGGLRMAQEMTHPHVVRFLDDMLREREDRIRIEEARVGTVGEAIGKTLSQARIRDATGTLVIAVRDDEGRVQHAPPGEHVIKPGETLISIGRADQLERLRNLVGDPPPLDDLA